MRRKVFLKWVTVGTEAGTAGQARYPRDAMSSPSSQISSDATDDAAAWDEAFLRVESYLRAHHLQSRVLLNRLVTDIVREARERVSATPSETPVNAAMAVMHARIGAWFARVGQAGDWSDPRVRVRARLALVLANLPATGMGGFLSDEPVSPALAAAFAPGVLQPGPRLRFSNMSAAPLEFGFDDPENPHAPKRSLLMSARAAAGWLLISGFFGVAWAASH